MAYILEKNKAIVLRKRGKSIEEISNALGMPKSTVSIWCRNVKLNGRQIKRLAKRQISGSYKGRMRFLEKVRAARQKETRKLMEEGLKEIGKLDYRDLFIGGVAMYCSEGATSSCNEQTSFSNSDPKMILYMLEWFKKICSVKLNKFVIQVRINKSHKKRVKDIEKYWSKLIDIPLSQFTKTILIEAKQKKVYLKPKDYYGTVRIMIRNGTAIRRKIMGWIEGLLKI